MAGIYTDYSQAIKNFGGFKFADPEAAAKANPSNPKAAKTEYRLGIFNAAKTRIAQSDTNGDKKLDFTEYSNEQLKLAERDKFSEEEIASLKQDFASLDINSDGFIDSKEVANEFALLDNQGEGSDKCDGIITMDESARLYGGGKTSEEITSALKENWDKFNCAKLGTEEDDIIKGAQQLPLNNAAPKPKVVTSQTAPAAAPKTAVVTTPTVSPAAAPKVKTVISPNSVIGVPYSQVAAQPNYAAGNNTIKSILTLMLNIVARLLYSMGINVNQ